MNISQENILQNLQIKSLNKMQIETIQAFPKQKELVLLSPTGSGKTLAFLLPLVSTLKKQNLVQVLILVPSRELALQIESVFKQMQTGIKVSCCYGGHAIKVEKNNLLEPPSLLIGTPGRVDDLIKRRILDLSHVETVVLDEFDKCLEYGYKEEMSFILQKLKTLKKTVLTSATNLVTFPEFLNIESPFYLDFLGTVTTNKALEIKKVYFDNNPNTIIKNLDKNNDADNKEPVTKFHIVHQLLGKLSGKQVIVFFNHKDAVKRLSSYLKNNAIIHTVFHGDLEQDERERTLSKFRNGSSLILLATDLASRGLDIPEIDGVIHYHLPVTEEAYTHRNGRTARMNAKGVAYVLVPDANFNLPSFMDVRMEEEYLSGEMNQPKDPEWETLYISKGKKDKINKIDIVGFLSQKGKLTRDDLGLIEVKDFHAYAAVKRNKIHKVIELVQNEKLKNGKAKIEIAR